MSGVAIQGVAFEYGKVFVSDGKAWLARPGCFGSIDNVELLIGHEGKSLADTDNRLQIYSGEDALIFRAYFPDEWFTKQVSDKADEMESYFAVSAGFKIMNTETVMCEGVPVRVILEAKMSELSLINAAPAVDTTYARIVSEDACNDELKSDYEMIRTVGRFVGLHRKITAADNEGEVKYAHSPSAYERAGDRFRRALAALA